VSAPAPSRVVGKLVVVGVGLIGGSCALALKAQGAVREVVGVGRTQGNLDEALERGIVDRACTLDGPWGAELADADVVLVATPVAQIAPAPARMIKFRASPASIASLVTSVPRTIRTFTPASAAGSSAGVRSGS
jgi:prephenate dehydrogenase